MKNKSISSLTILLTLISIFGSNILLANATSGTTFSTVTNPTVVTTPIIPLPADPNAIWMGNLSVSNNPYDVGNVNALHLKFDYKNIPEVDALPQIIIYKDGDASKTDLKKNYINYNISKNLATAKNGPQTGTVDYPWFAEASTEKYLEAGTYIFQISWSNSTKSLPTQTLQFNITNNDHLSLLRFANLTATPTPFNPNTGDNIKFNFTIYGLHSLETVNFLQYKIVDAGLNKIYTGLASNLNNGANSISWDGKDTMVKTVPDGTYALYLEASTSQNRFFSTTPVSFTINSNVTNPPPVTIIPPAPVDPNTPPQTPQTPSTPSTPATPASPTTTESNCSGFSDIKSTDANCAIYTWAKTAGIFTGNADGTFNPNGLLQRDQVIKTVLEAFKKYQSGTEYCTTGDAFPDIAKDSWAREYVCLAKSTYVRGAYLVTGYQTGPYKGLFVPGNNVNRSEFLAMILRNLQEEMPVVTTKPYSDVELNQWDTGFAAYAAFHLSSIYPEPNLFRAKAVTRMEAAKVFYALHNLGAF